MRPSFALHWTISEREIISAAAPSSARSTEERERDMMENHRRDEWSLLTQSIEPVDRRSEKVRLEIYSVRQPTGYQILQISLDGGSTLQRKDIKSNL